jgi:hypothetical protein
MAATLVDISTERRILVARQARGALAAAGALGKTPTPLDDIAAAMQLLPAENLFELGVDAPPGLIAKVMRLAGRFKGAIAIKERTVYIDRNQDVPQARFTMGHELGHKGLPWHEGAYYADDEAHLRPETRVELEAEANAFSAELLFNLQQFTNEAHSTRLGLATPLSLTGPFQTSRRATIRRYVEDAPRACALVVFGRHIEATSQGPAMRILNGLESAQFRDKYGPIMSCVPTLLPIGANRIAQDAHVALRGTSEPVTVGQVTLPDTKRGAARLDYELHSNTYVVFGLFIPHRSIIVGQRVKAKWSDSRTFL